MVNLKWKGKNKIKNLLLEANQIEPFHILDIYPSIGTEPNKNKKWQNQLIWGENKVVMNALLKNFENKITLIYIDPPFATGGDFNLKIQIGEVGNFVNEIAYQDKWKEGLDTYLNFLYKRLMLMKKLLADNGSIYIHLDWHISHYVKLMLDEIFGINNFRNEIVWAYPAASVKTRRFFIRSYDTILFYSKSDDCVFNNDPNIYMEYSDRVKKALKEDEHGVFYYRGGSHNGKKLSRKVYVNKKGIFPRDVWNDIPYIRANTSEYQGFSTQKPERLLKRIILASTNPSDLVADFFCGSGTTLAVAEKLGRRWIGCDSNKHSIHLSRKRILNIKSSNDILNWNKKYGKNYQSFKILGVKDQGTQQFIPEGFLIGDTKIEEILKIQEAPKISLGIEQNEKTVRVKLIDYKNPYENFISRKIRKDIISFSDWIDFWAIDYEFNNQIFNNTWFSCRSTKNRKLMLNSNPHLYTKPGNYKIAIKVVDILGLVAQKSIKVHVL